LKYYLFVSIDQQLTWLCIWP